MVDWILYYFIYVFNVKVLLIIIGIYFIYKLGTIRYNLHSKLGHKGPPPLPYLGNLFELCRDGFQKTDRKNLQQYGKIYPYYMGSFKLSIVADENIIKQILVKDSKCFTENLDSGLKIEQIEKSMFFLKGKEWERMRTLVSPAFTSGKLKKMMPLMSECIELFEKRVSEHKPDVPIDFKEFFGALVLDIIGRTFLGMHIDIQTNPNNKFLKYGKHLVNLSTITSNLVLFYIFPKLYRVFQKVFSWWNPLFIQILIFFFKNLQKAAEEKQKSSEEFNDFMGMMINFQKESEGKDENQLNKSSSKKLSVDEIISQCMTFLLAGYNGTSSFLTFLAYFLAMNPNAQEEVYNEILKTFKNEEEISYECLINMPLLDAAISETLRICPVLMRMDKVCTKDITLTTSEDSEIFARKGDIFSIPLYAIQMDPSNWPNPELYDLHRFDVENKKFHKPFTYFPFGTGPRVCLGTKFVYLITKWTFMVLLRKYKIVSCKETLEPLSFKKSDFSHPKKTIFLKVQIR